jgi:hypothetical protein
VVAFGVSAFAAILGLVMIWVGLFLRRLEPAH